MTATMSSFIASNSGGKQCRVIWDLTVSFQIIIRFSVKLYQFIIACMSCREKMSFAHGTLEEGFCVHERYFSGRRKGEM